MRFEVGGVVNIILLSSPKKIKNHVYMTSAIKLLSIYILYLLCLNVNSNQLYRTHQYQLNQASRYR